MAPNDCLSVGVLVKIFLQLLPWEWVQLLNTSNGCILNSIVGTVLVESSVNLTSAEDNTLDLLGIIDGFSMFSFRNDPLELRITSELFNG